MRGILGGVEASRAEIEPTDSISHVGGAAAGSHDVGRVFASFPIPSPLADPLRVCPLATLPGGE